MKRALLFAALAAVGILAIPSSAAAISDCTYATGTTQGPVTVYGPGGGRTAASVIGVCLDTNTLPFDGEYVELGVGEDPATGAADPGAVNNQPDVYLVADGSDTNSDPADGYIGVSNYENGTARTNKMDCETTGPDNGQAGTTNSGGCIQRPVGPVGWVYIEDDVPTPVCGNTSGNDWAGASGAGAPNKRDGCSIP